MTKALAFFLVAMMGLAPALVAAQTGGAGSGSGAAGSSGAASGGSGATGSGAAGSGATGATGTTSGGPSGAGASPSASPSPSSSSTSDDFAQYTTQADCEKAGGTWELAANKCAKK
jgi:hypothetical protein